MYYLINNIYIIIIFFPKKCLSEPAPDRTRLGNFGENRYMALQSPRKVGKYNLFSCTFCRLQSFKSRAFRVSTCHMRGLCFHTVSGASENLTIMIARFWWLQRLHNSRAILDEFQRPSVLLKITGQVTCVCMSHLHHHWSRTIPYCLQIVIPLFL